MYLFALVFPLLLPTSESACINCGSADKTSAKRLNMPNKSVFTRLAGIELMEIFEITKQNNHEVCAQQCDAHADCAVFEPNKQTLLGKFTKALPKEKETCLDKSEYEDYVKHEVDKWLNPSPKKSTSAAGSSSVSPTMTGSAGRANNSAHRNDRGNQRSHYGVRNGNYGRWNQWSKHGDRLDQGHHNVDDDYIGGSYDFVRRGSFVRDDHLFDQRFFTDEHGSPADAAREDHHVGYQPGSMACDRQLASGASTSSGQSSSITSSVPTTTTIHARTTSTSTTTASTPHAAAPTTVTTTAPLVDPSSSSTTAARSDTSVAHSSTTITKKDPNGWKTSTPSSTQSTTIKDSTTTEDPSTTTEISTPEEDPSTSESTVSSTESTTTRVNKVSRYLNIQSPLCTLGVDDYIGHDFSCWPVAHQVGRTSQVLASRRASVDLAELGKDYEQWDIKRNGTKFVLRSMNNPSRWRNLRASEDRLSDPSSLVVNLAVNMTDVTKGYEQWGAKMNNDLRWTFTSHHGTRLTSNGKVVFTSNMIFVERFASQKFVLEKL
ncbi:hypothetical protein PRIPAC_72545 [Pristionchus pacificus]|uniref:Uncharacterized protein n=1 Tax=Pristionchus pacificus TaxID=54126 RepID=A0A2A6D0M3_PRIPA|nr:hypothetical protein PRIPAC_72545 [Pristionchus pacificus]|eukprot:PDM83867.1 hypothetical protein PRIPAC_30354 [Pristionchus pacificus]